VRWNPIVYVVVLVGLLTAYWVTWTPEPESDRVAMIGTWTDEAGPPGNSVRFYFVRRDIPGVAYVEAWDGHLAVANVTGQTDAAGTWGYGSWEPLVLNLTINGRPWYAAIRKLDDDHLLVRFGTNAEEMYRADAIDHPDARVLTRIGREAGTE
jgi:hypothetical protein